MKQDRNRVVRVVAIKMLVCLPKPRPVGLNITQGDAADAGSDSRLNRTQFGGTLAACPRVNPDYGSHFEFMKILRRLLTTVGILFAFAAPAAESAAGDKGWVALFDGKTLDGWVQRGGKAKYEVMDGQIVGTSVANTPNSFLCTRRDYTNFVLELDFKVDPTLNSGVQIRSQWFEEPKEVKAGEKTIKIPAGRVHGYQIEIDPSARAWTGGIYDEGRRGWLNDLKANPTAQKAFKQGEWNSFRVECRGDSIKTWVNGVPAADLKDGFTPSGFIALQVHGIGKEEKTLQIRWRNVRLKEL